MTHRFYQWACQKANKLKITLGRNPLFLTSTGHLFSGQISIRDSVMGRKRSTYACRRTVTLLHFAGCAKVTVNKTFIAFPSYTESFSLNNAIGLG